MEGTAKQVRDGTCANEQQVFESGCEDKGLMNYNVTDQSSQVEVSTLIASQVEKWQNLKDSLDKSFLEISPNFKPIRQLLVYLEAVREAAHLPLGFESALSIYDLISEAANQVP